MLNSRHRTNQGKKNEIKRFTNEEIADSLGVGEEREEHKSQLKQDHHEHK